MEKWTACKDRLICKQRDGNSKKNEKEVLEIKNNAVEMKNAVIMGLSVDWPQPRYQ